MSAHGAKRRFYTPDEVRAHNTAKDCWVSIFRRVFDLTEVIAQNRGPLTQPIIDVRTSVRPWSAILVGRKNSPRAR
jgi:hypothetical protein